MPSASPTSRSPSIRHSSFARLTFNSFATMASGRFRSFASLSRHAPIAATCARASASERNISVSFQTRVKSCGVFTSCQPPKIITGMIGVPLSARNCNRSQRLALRMGSNHHGNRKVGDSPVQTSSSWYRSLSASPTTAVPSLENFTRPANSPTMYSSPTPRFLPMRRTVRSGPSPNVVTTSTLPDTLLWLPGAAALTTTAMHPSASRSWRATAGRKMMSP
mmetsp:Transcript_33611/g.92823  ORF Transcript_33611/g.92823 Transcript_33611/m.92823 type:complete len:221 (+) Transcript_33611:310-972(+)